jgi:hypothetical protein
MTMRDRIWINPAHDCPELRAIVRAARPDAQIMGRAPKPAGAPFPSELTELGEQLVIPGCEKRPTPGNKVPQPDLWDAASKDGR